MSISIFGALASPHNIPDGSTSVNITFKGRSVNDGTNVKVQFTISPYPDLSLGGSVTIQDNYVFDKKIKSFSKTVTIVNPKLPTSLSWLPGKITLHASETGTGNNDTTYTGLQYK